MLLLTRCLGPTGIHDDDYFRGRMDRHRACVDGMAPLSRLRCLLWMQSLRNLLRHDLEPDSWRERVGDDRSWPEEWFDRDLEVHVMPSLRNFVTLDGRPFLGEGEGGVAIVRFGHRGAGVSMEAGQALLCEAALLAASLATDMQAVAALAEADEVLLGALAFCAYVVTDLPDPVLLAAGIEERVQPRPPDGPADPWEAVDDDQAKDNDFRECSP